MSHRSAIGFWVRALGFSWELAGRIVDGNHETPVLLPPRSHPYRVSDLRLPASLPTISAPNLVPFLLELRHDALQVLREFLPDVFTFQAELNVGLDEIELVPDVVAFAGEAQPVHPAVGEHGDHRVGQLDLTVLARLGLRDVIEDRGVEDIAARDREVGRRFVDLRLLDQLIDFNDAVALALAAGDAVARDLVRFHFFEGDDGLALLFVDVEHLALLERYLRLKAFFHRST